MPVDPVTVFYAVVPGVLAWLFYLRVSAQKWTAEERRSLLERRLELFPVLDLLGGDDLRTLMLDNYGLRREVFTRYSEAMRRDVTRLVRTNDLSMTAVPLVGLFLVCYWFLRTKQLVYCNYRDVFFLSGLELTILRHLDK